MPSKTTMHKCLLFMSVSVPTRATASRLYKMFRRRQPIMVLCKTNKTRCKRGSHTRIPATKWGGPILVTPRCTVKQMQVIKRSRDSSPLDTHTTIETSPISEMPTHRRTSRSRCLTPDLCTPFLLVETMRHVRFQQLPAPPRCHGIASGVHQRIPIAHFEEDRFYPTSPPTTQTTLPTLPYVRLGRQTDLSLDLRAKAPHGTERHPDKKCQWIDRLRPVLSLLEPIIKGKTVTVQHSLRPHNTHTGAPVHKGRVLSKTQEV